MAYSGYEITDADRVALLSKFPGMFPDFIGHHVTWEFGTNENSELPPADVRLFVSGHAYGYVPAECLTITMRYPDGSETVFRPDGRQLHLTWTIDRERGAKPVDSNKTLHYGTIDLVSDAYELTVVPKFFK